LRRTVRAAFERAVDPASLGRVISGAIATPATARIIAVATSSSADGICLDTAIGMRRDDGAQRRVPRRNAASLRTCESHTAIGTATPCRIGMVVVAQLSTTPQSINK